MNIKAESLSSINLIPKIISHARYVQENIINSNIVFNQTLPWINLDLTLNMNGSNCSQDIQLLAKDLYNKQTWALKTLDAWGKFPSGVMQGNIFWIGSTYECEHHLRGLNNTVVEQPFQTRTCLIINAHSSTVQPIYGICVPRSCSEQDLINYINQHVIQIPYIKKLINLANDSMHCIDQRSYDTKAVLTIVILCIIIFLILVTTGLHIVYGHKHVLQTNETTFYEPILSRTTTEGLTTTINTSTIRKENNEQDESTPLIARSRQTTDSFAQHLIKCCSLMTNYRVLKVEQQPKIISCLNGIRVFSLWWIILCHTFLYAAYYSDNILTIFNWSRNLWFQIILQGVFSVDSFFVLSGLLTTFIFLIMKNENENFSILKFLFNHYIYRYLRYTIIYAIILLIFITISPYLGQGGPVYPINGSETDICRHSWWRNLLYINNFYHMQDGCMPITWFLAVNMQFHWISPLFLLTASWNWIFGMLVGIAFILVDVISTAVIVSKNNYEYGLFSDMYSTKANASSITNDYTNDVYIKPWCRIAPYAIGLMVGYILYEIYKRSKTLSWDALLPETRVTRSSQIKRWIAWICALVLLALCIFGTYGDYNGHILKRSERIAFLTLSRLGWSIGLSIIIITCFVGHGGIVNRFLSHSIFELLAKLTYGAYLWHSLVIFVNYLSRDQPIHYTISNILSGSILHISMAYALSFFTFLFIEIPIIQLLKQCFKRPATL